MLSGKTIEEILEKFDWKEFEKVISEIFKTNNFKVYRNFRLKTKRRYEIDIIATRGNKVLCVDCKEWKKGRYKKSRLRKEMERQVERVEEFVRFLKKNPVAQTKLNVNLKKEFHPFVVTLLQEEIVKEGNTFAIPVWKLNSFLNEIERYL